MPRTAKTSSPANLGFEAKHAELVALQDEGADPEHPDEYRAEGKKGGQFNGEDK